MMDERAPPEADPERGVRWGWTIPAAGALVLLGLLVGLSLVRRQPAAGDLSTPDPPPSRFQQRLAADPALGTPVPIPRAAGLHPEHWDRTATFLILVFVPSCSVCYESVLMSWQFWSKDYPQAAIVVVTSDSVENRRDWEGSERVWLPIAFDPQNRLQEVYNAFFPARAYLVDRQGRLLFAQTDRGLFSGAPIGEILDKTASRRHEDEDTQEPL